MFVPPPPHFQTQNVGLGIEPTDICDVTLPLAWLASRCWARQMCPPPILSRSYAVDVYVCRSMYVSKFLNECK